MFEFVKRNDERMLSAFRDPNLRTALLAREERKRTLSLVALFVSGLLAVGTAIVDSRNELLFTTFIVWTFAAALFAEQATGSIRLLRISEWMGPGS